MTSTTPALAALRSAHAEGEHVDHHPACPTCAWFDLPATRAGLRERMAVVRALASGDPETAHRIEDAIARGALAMIAASEPDAAGLAAEVRAFLGEKRVRGYS